jgi:hypothetical protein
MSRQLTEMQQKFLEVLFEEARGDFVQAKKLAGYSDTYSTKHIVESLEDEIAELTKKFIARVGTKAAYSIYEVMQDPTALGNKEKMLAAKDLLDRGGFKARDEVKIEASAPLFILPAKQESLDTDE